MNYSFFRKTFRDFKWSIILYSLIVLLYGVLIISFFPSIQESSVDFEKLLESYPPVFMEAFGINFDTIGTIEGFLSMEYLSVIWVIIMGILIFSLGASIVSKEVDKGTSEFSFTLPLKRWKIVLSKFIASFCISIIIVLITLASVIAGAYMIEETINLKGFFAFSLIAFALYFFLLSFATFFSSIFSDKGKVFSICGGFLVLSYVLHVFVKINESISSLYFLSFFKYYGNPEVILRNGSIDVKNILVLLSVGLIFLIFGLIVSERRDL